jgi:hypothetical protein
LHKNCGALTKDTVAVADSELAAMVAAAAAAVCEIPCVMRRLHSSDSIWHIIPCNVDVGKFQSTLGQRYNRGIEYIPY